MYSGNSIPLDEKNLDIIPKISFILKVDREKLERDSMKTYPHIKLMQCEAEIFNLAKKYGISSAEDFENSYKRGELEEEGRADHYVFRAQFPLLFELESIFQNLTYLSL